MQSNTSSTLKSELNGAAAKGQKMAKSAASDLSGQVDTLVHRAEEIVKRYEPEVKAAARTTVDFVRRHPVACVLGAAAIGYAIVAFARRNSRG